MNLDAARFALQRLSRDSETLPVAALLSKGLGYVAELVAARVFLGQVDALGAGVRAHGRPRVENRGTIRLGRNVQLCSTVVPVQLSAKEGAVIDIGDECFLNFGTTIGAVESVRLGRRVLTGPYAMVIDCEFHELYRRNQRPPARPVTIEDDVWIGAKASILPGVTIGRGAVIGVSAVVAHDVPPFTIVAGVPARHVRKLDPTLFELELA